MVHGGCRRLQLLLGWLEQVGLAQLDRVPLLATVVLYAAIGVMSRDERCRVQRCYRRVPAILWNGDGRRLMSPRHLSTRRYALFAGYTGLAFIWLTGGYVLVALFAPYLPNWAVHNPDFLGARMVVMLHARWRGVAIMCSFVYLVAQIYEWG